MCLVVTHELLLGLAEAIFPAALAVVVASRVMRPVAVMNLAERCRGEVLHGDGMRSGLNCNLHGLIVTEPASSY